jgi:hypothetical protein
MLAHQGPTDAVVNRLMQAYYLQSFEHENTPLFAHPIRYSLLSPGCLTRCQFKETFRSLKETNQTISKPMGIIFLISRVETATQLQLLVYILSTVVLTDHYYSRNNSDVEGVVMQTRVSSNSHNVNAQVN